MREFVRVHEEGRVAVLVIDRPPFNRLDRRSCLEIAAAARRLATADVGAVLVHGGEKIFSAGSGDTDVTATVDVPGPHLDAAISALRRLADSGRPVVAGITGYALGDGLRLALACDRRIAGDNVITGLTAEHPGFRDARATLESGLVERLVAPDDVYDEALAVAADLASAHP